MINGASYNRAVVNQATESQFVTLVGSLEGAIASSVALYKQTHLETYLEGELLTDGILITQRSLRMRGRATANSHIEFFRGVTLKSALSGTATPNITGIVGKILQANIQATAQTLLEFNAYKEVVTPDKRIYYTSVLSGNDTDSESERTFYVSKLGNEQAFYTS